MFENLCTFPLESDLFTQAVHPTEPLVAVGLSSGHVTTLKLPTDSGDGDDNGTVTSIHSTHSNGTDFVDTAWKTRRHKGSCRCLGYSVDGRSLYSAGTDGIVKAADAETGRVTGKVAIPLNGSSPSQDIDGPTALHALSPQTLLLSTDSGALHLYDLRDPAPALPISGGKAAFINAQPSQTHHPHTDYISSLTPIPPSAASTSGYSKQFLTTGGTTLALTDLRRGVLVKSEDQEELLLSSLYVTGLAAKKSSGSTGQKALVGGGDGVITLWEKGQWDDQDERITVSREKETVDAMALIPNGIGGPGKKVAVGLGDGKVRFVRLGMNRVVGECLHAQQGEVEGVVAVDFDVGGRMVTGGGQVLKVWQEPAEIEEPEQDEVEEDEDAIGAKRGAGSDDDSDEEVEEDSSDEEEKTRTKRKKRKRGKGPQSQSGFNFAGLD